MSLLAKYLNFNTGTGTANIPVTGAGFLSKVVILMGVKTNASADAVVSLGAFTGPTERVAVGAKIDDGAATTASASGIMTDGCFIHPTTVPGVDGELDAVSLDADGFTVVPDNAFPNSARVHALCLGGDDLTNVKVGTITLGAGTGNQSFTGVGFQPDCLIFFYAKATNGTANTLSAHAGIGLGFAKSSSERYAIGAGSQNNVADTNSRTLLMSNRCIAMPSTTADTIALDADFVSMDADGFTINKVTGAGTPVIGYVALKGGQYKIGATAMRTDTNPQIVSDVAFLPSALMAMFAPEKTAVDTVAPTAHWEWGVGFATAAAARGAIWTADEDALAVSDTYSQDSTSRVVLNFDKETGAVDGGDMDFTSFNSDGFTLDQDTAAAAAILVPYLVMGDAAVVPPAGPGSSARRIRNQVVLGLN
jgi:hypothetical protein